MIDYRSFRPSLINTPKFSHLKYLLYWPIYGIAFALLERGVKGRTYYPVESALDSCIPFCEYFLIPYMLWFVYLVGGVFYGCLFDVRAFKRYMQFVMLTYTVTVIIYMIFPTCQNLRPTTFENDNFFTRFIAGFYVFDTNTNVCPSIHVLGAVAVSYGAWNSKHFGSYMWRVIFSIATVFISLSTVFMKQHSIIDVFASAILCAVAVPICQKIEQRSERRSCAKARPEVEI